MVLNLHKDKYLKERQEILRKKKMGPVRGLWRLEVSVAKGDISQTCRDHVMEYEDRPHKLSSALPWNEATCLACSFTRSKCICV